jgi:hypothetical protein
MHFLLEANGACSHPEMNAGAASQKRGHWNKQAFHISFFFRLFSDGYHLNRGCAILKSFLINVRRDNSGCHPANGGR